jgi:hypothetical protein
VSKAKPCPKMIHGQPTVQCGRPKMKGKQACLYHWLLRQSSDVQAAYARARLAAWGEAPTIPRVKIADCPEGERWCAGCQSFVPLFYTSGSRCKACVSMAAHARRLEQVYDIDAAEYERLHELQGRRCAICRNQSRTIRLAVDHDHKTGAVRGLLCKRCNHELLGAGHDSVEILWRAIGYLLFPPAQNDLFPLPGEIVEALKAHLEAGSQPVNKPVEDTVEPPF